MKLFEVMDTKIEPKWTEYDDEYIGADFVLDGVKVHVAFEEIDNPFFDEDTNPFRRTWGLTFDAKGPGQKYSTFSKTGLGNEFKMFAIVGNIVKDFIKKHHNPPLYFSAQEPSRQKLYTRFEKTIRSWGYELMTKDHDEHGDMAWMYVHKSMNEARDYTKQQLQHSELKLLNMMDKKDYGKKANTKTTDTLVKDSKTKTIYGRRAIVQRDL